MDFSSVALPHARSSLMAAIKYGDKARFEEVLDTNCAVDVADNRGWRPLHLAAFLGRHDFVHRLLQHEDTDVNWTTPEGETALWLATSLGREQTCQVLLRHSARTDIANNEQQYPLHIGATKQNLGCVRLLLRNGAQIDAVDRRGRTALHKAVFAVGHVDTVRLLLESGARVDLADLRGVTPLFLAAESGSLPCVKAICEQLCSHTVDAVTLDGTTPLMIAAQRGRLDCLSYLLEEGADACHAAHDGALAIHLATQNGHLSCVKVLMPMTGADALLGACYGKWKTADPNFLRTLRNTLLVKDDLDLPNRGISVLHLAIECDRIDILDYLLKSGVDPNMYVIERFYNWGRTPLLETALGLACHKCSEEVVNVLVNAGARFLLGNNSVSDPLHRAYCNPKCSREFLRFLVARGADIRACFQGDRRFLLYFKRPDLLLEVMALGGWCAKDAFDDSSLRPCWGVAAIVDVMFVLVRFLPATDMRRLYDKCNSFLRIRDLVLERRWEELWEIVVTPRTLREQCRAKMREVLMARDDYNLQRDIPKLDLPVALQDYLLFREK